jgi:hypothetical protein
MEKIQNSKQYDLEDRTLEFGKRIIHFTSFALKMLTLSFPT